MYASDPTQMDEHVSAQHNIFRHETMSDRRRTTLLPQQQDRNFSLFPPPSTFLEMTQRDIPPPAFPDLGPSGFGYRSTAEQVSEGVDLVSVLLLDLWVKLVFSHSSFCSLYVIPLLSPHACRCDGTRVQSGKVALVTGALSGLGKGWCHCVALPRFYSSFLYSKYMSFSILRNCPCSCSSWSTRLRHWT